MMTTITDPSDGSRLPQATAYRYDQLNRLLEERAFANINETQNKWNSSTGSYNNQYFNYFTYDGNGNIVTQRRHNKAGSLVDSLNRVAKHVLTSAGVEESATYYVRDAQGNIMTTYLKTAPHQTLSYQVEKRHIYGSFRMGI